MLFSSKDKKFEGGWEKAIWKTVEAYDCHVAGSWNQRVDFTG